MATVMAAAGFILEGVVLLAGLVLVAVMLWRAPLVGALAGGGVLVAFVGWVLGFLLLALHQQVAASASSLWADDAGLALVLAGLVVAMWRARRPPVDAPPGRRGGPWAALSAVLAVLVVLLGVLGVVLVARGGSGLPGSNPAASATTQCGWVESTLEQDSRNDIRNRPPGTDGAPLDKSAHAWLVIDNMVRAAPCAGQASTTAPPDAAVPDGYLAGTPPAVTQAGCAYELGWVYSARYSHSSHLQYLEQGGQVPWPNESRAYAERWDRTWIANYTKIGDFVELQGDCAQFGIGDPTDPPE